MAKRPEEPSNARQAARAGRVPPHDLAAEESLLGAMMLSPEAIAAAAGTVSSADFYKPAHGHIFDAIHTLYAAGQPVDPVTVADELRRAGLLDAIGGPAILAQILATTPATTNAGRYAGIIEEYALLRRLITVAGEVAEIGYSVPDDVPKALDRAEALIYDVNERRVTDSTKPLSLLLSDNLDRLEHLHGRGEAITGVPTGYHDLDHLLSGLQPSALVVVGARPAMGKALALDTPVPTPAGWTTMGSLAVGDQVFDEQGHPCSVTYVSPVQLGRPCYEVGFDDGTTLLADADHQWLVYDRPAWRARAHGVNRGRVLGTRQLLDAGLSHPSSRPRWYIPLALPLDLPDRDLPVDPYDLGRGLGGALIPPAYLRASAKQRLSLLQGVMDARGCVTGDGRAVELCLTDRALLRQVRELALSLGHRVPPERACVARSPGAGMPRWRLRWVPLDPVFRDEAAGVVQGARPAEVPVAHPWAQRWSGRAISFIRPVDSVPVRCITVDSPSRLYLAGWAMVPTHNTSFALGMVANAALDHHRPVLFFSLEMSSLELSQRLLCAEARIDSSRMRNGQLQGEDWKKISKAVGRLAEAPIWIDDNPNLTIMEIRAKARRLRSQIGDLGMIVVDYLQLMTGRSNAENRQVEVSELSRGLKILARELETPVVALSQLSRNLEMRADKRPMLADLRESGCLTADARVARADTGAEVTIGELAQSGERDIPVWSLDEHLRLVPARMERAFPTGTKEVFELRLASGRRVTASANHPFLTVEGWARLDELVPGRRIATPRRLPEPLDPRRRPPDEVVMAAHLLAQGCAEAVPPDVFRLPDDQLALFLAHLWFADVGLARSLSGWEGAFELSVPSRRLATDVQLLLGRFGVHSRVVTGGRGHSRPGHRVHVGGAANRLRFLDRVGAADRRRTPATDLFGALAETADSADSAGTPADALADTVPGEVWKRVHAAIRATGLSPAAVEAALADREGPGCGSGLYRPAPSRERLSRVATLVADPVLCAIAEGDALWDEVVAIEPRGLQPVYDATVAETHNFVANGIVVENSIEQDSDVVIFIYREEVYDPKPENAGHAEILVAKHRTGPTGVVQLAFLPQYTRFANMARGFD